MTGGSRRKRAAAAITLCDADQVRAKIAEIVGTDPANVETCELGEPDDDFPFFNIGSEERRRATVLKRLLNNPIRSLIVADRRMEQQLELLKAEMPHFAAAIDILLGKVAVSRRTGAGLSFPPLLLAGPPGLGKTHFARRVAKILGTYAEFIHGANAVELKMNLGGLGPAWKGAREGQVARALMASDSASPVIVVDELDKVSAVARGGDPTDCLLALLEPENAIVFIDEYLEVPIRADRILWMLTANDTTALTAPLLDRVLVVEIARPDRAATRRIAAAIFADLNQAAGQPLKPRLANRVLDQMAEETPRAIRKLLDIAIGFAVRSGRNQLTPDDIGDATDLLNAGAAPTRKVGFVRDFKGAGRD